MIISIIVSIIISYYYHIPIFLFYIKVSGLISLCGVAL